MNLFSGGGGELGAGSYGGLADTGGALSGADMSSLGVGQNGGVQAGSAGAQHPAQKSGGGGGIGKGLGDSVRAIGEAISGYLIAGAQGQQNIAAKAPQYTMDPVMANQLPLANLPYNSRRL